MAGNGSRDWLDGWDEADAVLGGRRGGVGREKGSPWWKGADGMFGGRE